MEKPKVQYGYWEQDESIGYWVLFDTLADAVQGHEGEEIFEFRPKLLGTYKSKVVLVKNKKQKKQRETKNEKA